MRRHLRQLFVAAASVAPFVIAACGREDVILVDTPPDPRADASTVAAAEAGLSPEASASTGAITEGGSQPGDVESGTRPSA